MPNPGYQQAYCLNRREDARVEYANGRVRGPRRSAAGTSTQQGIQLPSGPIDVNAAAVSAAVGRATDAPLDLLGRAGERGFLVEQRERAESLDANRPLVFLLPAGEPLAVLRRATGQYHQ